ncbi:MAG: hypothetical protein KIT56_06110 [Gammaproteobacteria bacterium]|nr:hypothetical protein [Gammaproteobacteria bacterium]MCW5583443.1 hypothetical protein [Gammaproteobacteria bacterium]
MTNNRYLLPISETIRIAWHKTYGAKASIWAALGIMLAIMLCLTFLDSLLMLYLPTIEPAFDVVTQFIGYFLQMGVVYIGIKHAQDLPISYRMIRHSFNSKIAIRIFGLLILHLLILGILISGILITNSSVATPTSLTLSVLLYVVSIILIVYITVRISLSAAFVLDQASGPWEAIKLSFTATRSNFWRLCALYALQCIIVMVSIIPFGIGLIWALSFAYILYGTVYKSLCNHSRE